MCETFNSAEQLIEFLNKLINENKYVFRGYSYEEQMLPTIMRNDLVNKEFELISDFEKYAQQYLNADTVADMLSYAQHYGLPTRLLDFTYNPFIALYFAIYNEKDKVEDEDENKDKGKGKKKGKKISEDEKNYYFIRFAELNDNVIVAKKLPFAICVDRMEFYADDKVSQFKYIKEDIESNVVKNSNKDKSAIGYFNYLSGANNENYPSEDFLFLLDTNLSNQRLVMQQGLFMFPYTLDDTRHATIINKNTTKIKINKNLRDELLTYLDKIGVNTFKLMPDLSSVCSEIIKRNSRK